MKTVNINLPFESLDNKTYIKYIERAEMLHDQGLLLKKVVLELSKQMYEKDIENEN